MKFISRSERVKKYYKKIFVIVVAGGLGWAGVSLTGVQLTAVGTLADVFLSFF